LINAENPTLGAAAGLVSVDAATIFTAVATGTPGQLENSLNPEFAGMLLGFFTGGGTVLQLDSDADTGLGVELPVAITPVTPTSSPTIDFNYDTFSLALTIVASGAPLTVNDAGCTWDTQGDPITLPVVPN